MKIGIITLQLEYNYGGILQAYAMEEVLRRLGHEVEHIEKRKKNYLLPLKTRYLVYLKRALRRYILGENIRVFQEQYIHDTYDVVTQYTNRFMNVYLKRKYVSSFSEIREYDYDAYVVGSDQIWRSEYICKADNFAPFLDFTTGWNVRRVAYACSFAKDGWYYSSKATNCAAELLKKFDAISVRENSGVELCLKYLGVNSEHTIDPTMLLDKADYEKLVFAAHVPQSPGTLLCYILDESADVNSIITYFTQKYGLKAFRVNSKAEDKWAPVTERIQPSIEKWLRGFMDAKLVITDSFHACVFSIIFNKPFICLGNKERGMDRFYSLLTMFGQEFRLVTNINEAIEDSRLLTIPNIDLTLERKRCFKFLTDSLNK